MIKNVIERGQEFICTIESPDILVKIRAIEPKYN